MRSDKRLFNEPDEGREDVEQTGGGDIVTAHCLFEQSGTFKNEFKKLGINAFDYDILDEFGQTDFKVDLFKEIESGFMGG